MSKSEDKKKSHQEKTAENSEGKEAGQTGKEE